MNVRQILYTSTETLSMDGAALHHLRAESCTNNLRFDVTGLLLYVDRVFVQLIEGPGAAIEQLFGNIRRDDRNHSVTELLDRTVVERAFPRWSMGFRSSDQKDRTDYEAFENIQARQDLDTIACHDDKIFGLVKGLYVANAGRGF